RHAERDGYFLTAALASRNLTGQSLTTARQAVMAALADRDPRIRQTAWHALAATQIIDHLPAGSVEQQLFLKAAATLPQESNAAVRRQAWNVFAHRNLNGPIHDALQNLMSEVISAPTWTNADREERHAVLYAVLLSAERLKPFPYPAGRSHDELVGNPYAFELLTVIDQVTPGLPADMLQACIRLGNSRLVACASAIARRDATSGRLKPNQLESLNAAAAERLQRVMNDEHDPDMWSSLIANFGKTQEMSDVISNQLTNGTPHSETTLQLLSTLAGQASSSVKLSEAAQQRLRELLETCDNLPLQRLLLQSMNGVGADNFADTLRSLVHSERPSAVRLEALRTLASDNQALPQPERFDLLFQLFTNGTIEEQSTAARFLGSSSVTAEQLQQIAPLLQDAGPQQLNDLVALFNRSLTPEQAATFLDNIENARSLTSVPALTVSEIVKRFPPELHDRANALLDRLQAAEQEKLLKLDTVVGLLKNGNAAAGREVFFSEKAKCATCHVVGSKENGELLGKRVGPDLTTIGANRSSKDLLESILFPSATIVRQFEPYTLVANDGRSYSGLVIKDTSDEITIQQSTGDPVTVSRSDIEELVPSTVSIMPKGLDEQLTPSQIADLVTWLQSLRSANTAVSLR
ncbi:MAG: c-type cytochrome, partial [Planctomycetaceae bacterium]|nr:c-type cytochrome [Planctomycetaceae bacterium]